MFLRLFTIGFLLLSTQNYAYVASVYKQRSIRNDKPTHVFITGYPGKLGDMLVRTAHSKLIKYDRLYPDHQKIILMARGKRRQQKKFISLLQSKNYTILYKDKKKINTGKIYHHLKRLKNILTIDVVTHNAAEMGIGLEIGGVRMTYKGGYIKKLAANFGNQTYMVLHGCNTGFIMAPKMSKAWGIPVFGAMTGTDFQRQHNDGNWYFNNSGEYPSGGWTSQCHQKGGCVRMRPNNHPYSGHWGKYKAGLPFTCPFDKQAQL
jgi:hypothetical protein